MIVSWDSLPEILKPVLPKNYTYKIQSLNQPSPFQTQENFEILNFELDTFVNINTAEQASEWFAEFESHSKSTMPETKGFKITGKRVLFRELCHCIHSNKVKKKQRPL